MVKLLVLSTENRSEVIKLAGANTIISVITLNVNRLNTLTERMSNRSKNKTQPL